MNKKHLPKAYVQRAFEPLPGTKGPAKERFLVLTDVSHPTELAAYDDVAAARTAVRVHNDAVDNDDDSYNAATDLPPSLPVKERRDVYAGALDDLRKIVRATVNGVPEVRVVAVRLADLPDDQRAQIEAALRDAAADDAAAGIGSEVEQLTADKPRNQMPRSVEISPAHPIQTPQPGRSRQFGRR